MHVSTGDLLRASAGDSLDPLSAELISGHMRNGTLIPSDFVVPILRDHMIGKLGEGRKRFLLDGFPRNMEQHCLFEKLVSIHSQAKSECLK